MGGTGAADSLHVGLCTTTGAETDVGRASLPPHPRHVPGVGRQDHRHAPGDRQLGVGPHVGAPRVPQGKGRGGRHRTPSPPEQGRLKAYSVRTSCSPHFSDKTHDFTLVFAL